MIILALVLSITNLEFFMISLHDKVSLAERTVSSAHGEFTVSIDMIKIHRAGLDVEVKWSIRHGDRQEEQVFTMQWCDPLLKQCGYTHEKQELDQESFAETLVATLEVDFDRDQNQTDFCLSEKGFDICEPIHWSEACKCFM